MRLSNIQLPKVVLACCLGLALSGCTTTKLALGGGPSPTSTGNQVAASGDIIRALEGGLVTRVLGENISRGDKAVALQNEYQALEYTAPGEAVLWQGTSISGKIVPSQPYRVGSQDCRQYEHTVTDRASESTVRGTACRNEDGSWALLT